MIQQIQIRPNVPSPLTNLYIGKGILESDLLSDICQEIGGKIVIIADRSVAESIGCFLQKHLKAELLSIPGGESAKSKETQETILETLHLKSCGRDTILIALGGGAATDGVGFIASTFLRGVPLILIPTTLLAMVDASIGGKTAINTPFGKNGIGSLYYPKATLIDLNILDSLPEQEIWNGLAEIFKIGLVWDSSIWDLASNLKSPLLATVDLQKGEWISKAIQGKISIIQEDPMELGLRRILNFGHTIGHGLEKIADFQMPHGMAVAIGSLAEAHLSLSLGYLDANALARIEALYQIFPLQFPKQYTRERLFQAIRYDKKNIEGQVRFVLIDRIGHALSFNGAYCRHVTQKELEPTLQWMEARFG